MRERRAFWETGFDRMAARLDEMTDEEGDGDGQPGDE